MSKQNIELFFLTAERQKKFWSLMSKKTTKKIIELLAKAEEPLSAQYFVDNGIPHSVFSTFVKQLIDQNMVILSKGENNTFKRYSLNQKKIDVIASQGYQIIVNF